MTTCMIHPHHHRFVRGSAGQRIRNQFWIGVLALGALVAGAHSAAAQEYVGAIDMPLPFDMLGGQGMSLNPSTGRLYIPDYYGSNGVAVVDIVTDRFRLELQVPSALAT